MAQQKNKKINKQQGTVIATRVKGDFLNNLKALAEQDKRTLANMIYVLLCEAIEAREEKK